MKAFGAFLSGMGLVLLIVSIVVAKDPTVTFLVYCLYMTSVIGLYMVGYAYGRAEEAKKHENNNA